MSFKSQYGKELIGEAMSPKSKYVLCFCDSFPPIDKDYDKIKHFSDLVQTTDYVLVVIPQNEHSNVTNKVLGVYCQYLANVSVHVSSKKRDEFVQAFCSGVIEKNGGGQLIIGCTKDEVSEYEHLYPLCKKLYPDVLVISPVTTAVSLTGYANEREMESARTDDEEMEKLLPKHLSRREKDLVLNLVSSQQ